MLNTSCGEGRLSLASMGVPWTRIETGDVLFFTYHAALLSFSHIPNNKSRPGVPGRLFVPSHLAESLPRWALRTGAVIMSGAVAEDVPCPWAGAIGGQLTSRVSSICASSLHGVFKMGLKPISSYPTHNASSVKYKIDF